MYTARRGMGAFCNGKQIHCTGVTGNNVVSRLMLFNHLCLDSLWKVDLNCYDRQVGKSNDAKGGEGSPKF